MSVSRRSAAICGFLLSSFVAAGLAAPPQNLQVLRKDVTESELKRLMEHYSDELGVSCSYCHVEKTEGGELDYVSDDSPAKQTTRIMIAMLNDINKRYLGQLGDRRYALPFSCGNCHQGQTSPPEFDPKTQR